MQQFKARKEWMTRAKAALNRPVMLASKTAHQLLVRHTSRSAASEAPQYHIV